MQRKKHKLIDFIELKSEIFKFKIIKKEIYSKLFLNFGKFL